MLIGVAGKPSSGKSTFFSAATLVDVKISERPFTTIDPNKGVTAVRTECPCKELGIKCNPKNSKCVNGIRLVPVNMVDIAGLVPDAHLGRGMGNQFLSEIMTASAIIHIIDISGTTDFNGNPTSHHDPQQDIDFVEKEIDYWILGILKHKIESQIKRIDPEKRHFSVIIEKQLSGLNIKAEHVEYALNETGLKPDDHDDKYLEFIRILREKSKPIIIAANKIDINSDHYEKIKSVYKSVIPVSAASELSLRKAAEKGIIKYLPGDSSFEILKGINEHQKMGLQVIIKILDKYGSTGVQETINNTVFDILDMIIVFPVANEGKKSDAKGNILPDAIMLKKGSTPRDLAYKVHEDIGKSFICAVDARTKKNLASDYQLKHGDIVCIKSGK